MTPQEKLKKVREELKLMFLERADLIDGALAAFTFGAANWELRLNIDGQTSAIYRNLSRFADGSGSDVSGGYAGASPFDTHWFTVPMQFGTPWSIDVQLNITSVARINAGGVDGSAAGLVDLGHSAYWAGISLVTLQDGTPTAFTATAASGTDYIPSMVPEPTTWVLMLAGMGVVIWLAQEQPGLRRSGSRRIGPN